MINLVWRVGPTPTGRYRSFERRSWPSANFKGIDRPAAMIICTDEYAPWRVKESKHSELQVLVAIYADKTFAWKSMRATAKTLQEAKQLAWNFWNKESSKQYLPKELMPNDKITAKKDV